MQVLYINNDGGGFADHIEIESGLSLADFFEQRVHQGKSEEYLIRFNRHPVSSNYTLQEGDRISITPTKIEGAIL